MSVGRRIGIDLLDDDLKEMIVYGTNILPIGTIDELPTFNTGYYYRVLSGAEKNNIYVWDYETNKHELIGADDRDIRWEDVKNVPALFPPSAHTHTESEIIDLDKYTKAEVDAMLTDFITGEHTHTIADVSGLQGALDSKVSIIVGKGLSTNDFTDTLKVKLEALSDGASISYEELDIKIVNHINDNTVHVTSADRTILGSVASKADKSYVDTQLSNKADKSTFTGHTGNTTIHIDQTERDKWNAKASASDVITVSATQPTSAIWYKLL